MSGLVNYSSEDDQDDYQQSKGGERDRMGRNVLVGGKKKYRRRCSSSSESDSGSDAKNMTPPPQRKERGGGGGGNKNDRSSTTNNSNYHRDEDKYKSSDKRSDKYNRDQHRDRRDDHRDANKYSRDNNNRSGGGNRDFRDDNGSWHDNKKYDDKRHSKDHKRESGDYHKDEKRSRYEEKKFHSSSSYNKDRPSKSRYDDRKSYDDRKEDRRDDKRVSDERRSHGGGGSSSTHRRSDYNDRKDHRPSDDRNAQRSSNQDRSNSYRHNNKYSLDRRGTNTDDDRKQQSRTNDSPEKLGERSSSQREYSVETNSANRPEQTKSSPPPEGVEKKVLPSARNFEALLSLPLSETAPKQPNVVTVPPISDAGESEALTVQLPSYYNPKVINPNKYAQQIQKRKLIWGAKKVEDSASKWGHAQFSQDSDGKVASKFMRLMGIKNVPQPGETAESNASEQKKTDTAATPDYKSREAMFSTMEQQYEVARQVTHTMRGVGLGFSSQRPYMSVIFHTISEIEKKVLPSARNFEALLSLPLSETAPKQPNVVTVPPISDAGESEALTVQLPSYYNPKVINPNKYAQQIQKRKLIWGAKKVEDSASKWGHAQFSQDSDGKVASKFMRLMGIKNVPQPGETAESNASEQKKTDTAATPDYKSREAMFSTMEQQYEVARQVTHTMRGVGLGFSSQRPY
ncbi:uncharacterized protein LOC142231335 [Haematobia irritans]|uniref:uncharacterized protein LOC142231335 n=1 Tax=Haematobia irritans TaxID=7368 RepID=UPI003F5088B3